MNDYSVEIYDRIVIQVSSIDYGVRLYRVFDGQSRTIEADV